MRVVDLDVVVDSQQTLECISKDVEMQDLTHLDDFDHPLPPPIGSRVSDESTNHVAFNLNSTLVGAKVLAKYLLEKEKLRKVLKLKYMKDHHGHLRSLDHNFVG